MNSLIGNAKLIVLDSVYCPQEDSFLLAESIKVKKELKVLDVGTGCGIQAINVYMQGAKKVLAIDLNKMAIKNVKSNCKSLKIRNIKTRKSDLFENINAKEKFDLIIFNPPYVESEKIKWIDLDGGKKGREVLDKFLNEFSKHLEKNGECYFLQTDLNGLNQTKKKLKKIGFRFEIVNERKLFFEKLIIIRTWQENT